MNRLPNANGVPSSSPGLRGTRYPATPAPHEFRPQRGCAPCDVFPTNRTEPHCGSIPPPSIPKVGLIAFDQPWAGGRNPVGI